MKHSSSTIIRIKSRGKEEVRGHGDCKLSQDNWLNVSLHFDMKRYVFFLNCVISYGFVLPLVHCLGLPW